MNPVTSAALALAIVASANFLRAAPTLLSGAAISLAYGACLAILCRLTLPGEADP
jgi:hypothetical protein